MNMNPRDQRKHIIKLLLEAERNDPILMDEQMRVDSDFERRCLDAVLKKGDSNNESRN